MIIIFWHLPANSIPRQAIAMLAGPIAICRGRSILGEARLTLKRHAHFSWNRGKLPYKVTEIEMVTLYICVQYFLSSAISNSSLSPFNVLIFSFSCSQFNQEVVCTDFFCTVGHCQLFMYFLTFYTMKVLQWHFFNQASRCTVNSFRWAVTNWQANHLYPALLDPHWN